MTSKLGQRHKQRKGRKGQLPGAEDLDGRFKPRPIQPRSTQEAEASSGSNTNVITLPASLISDTPDLQIHCDRSKIALPAFDVGPIGTSRNQQPMYTAADDLSSIQTDGRLDKLGHSNILHDVRQLLDPNFVPDLDITGSMDMIGIPAPYLTISDNTEMDFLQLSSPSNSLKPDMGFAVTATPGPNKSVTTWLDASLLSHSTEAQGIENKDVRSCLEVGNRTPDTSNNYENNAYLADPYQNAISFSQATILSICAQNAKCLGMALENLINDNCLSQCSPFYRPVTASDDPTALLAAVSQPYTPRFLRPRLSQILFPHHPIFDLIPIPAFRERAIMLATTSPALLNPLELKKDIIYGGLVCWGSTHGSNHDGKGQPWDARSWEAAPWFLQKWQLLVGGKDGDLWKQSMWWRNFRGEPLAFD